MEIGPKEQLIAIGIIAILFIISFTHITGLTTYGTENKIEVMHATQDENGLNYPKLLAGTLFLIIGALSVSYIYQK